MNFPSKQASKIKKLTNMKQLIKLQNNKIDVDIDVEGVTLVLPSRPFMFIKYWRILALS